MSKAERRRQYYLENKEFENAYSVVYMLENKEKYSKSHSCKCGGKYKLLHKKNHERSKRHLNYLQFLEDILEMFGDEIDDMETQYGSDTE